MDVKETVEYLITECAGHAKERHSVVRCVIGIIEEKKKEWNVLKGRYHKSMSILLSFECNYEKLNLKRIRTVDKEKY